MAINGKKADKSAKVSLLSAIKAAGYEVSKQKTILWGEPTIVAEGLNADAFESLRVSDKYEDSIYAIIREGDESILVSFAKDQIDVDSVETDDKGIITAGVDDMTFTLGEVTALRDDEELGIAKGETKLKLFVE